MREFDTDVSLTTLGIAAKATGRSHIALASQANDTGFRDVVGCEKMGIGCHPANDFWEEANSRIC